MGFALLFFQDCDLVTLPKKRGGYPQLFRDNAAGDTIAGISGRIALQIVGLRMNHQRGATAGEHGICAFTQRHFRGVHRQLCRTVSFDREVRHIAGMWLWTFRIVHAVMRILRIEVTARGGECRSFTLSLCAGPPFR